MGPPISLVLRVVLRLITRFEEAGFSAVRAPGAGDASKEEWKDVMTAPFDGTLRVLPPLDTTTDLNSKAMADISSKLIAGVTWRAAALGCCMQSAD